MRKFEDVKPDDKVYDLSYGEGHVTVISTQGQGFDAYFPALHTTQTYNLNGKVNYLPHATLYWIKPTITEKPRKITRRHIATRYFNMYWDSQKQEHWVVMYLTAELAHIEARTDPRYKVLIEAEPKEFTFEEEVKIP